MDNLKIDLHEDFLNSEISEVELEHVEKIIDVSMLVFNLYSQTQHNKKVHNLLLSFAIELGVGTL